jgi:hypothetical protein
MEHDDIHQILHRTDEETVDRLYFNIISGEPKESFDLTGDESTLWDYFVKVIAGLPEIDPSAEVSLDAVCDICGGSVVDDAMFDLYRNSVTDLIPQCPSKGQNCSEEPHSNEWLARYRLLVDEFFSVEGARGPGFVSHDTTLEEMRKRGIQDAQYWRSVEK